MNEHSDHDTPVLGVTQPVQGQPVRPPLYRGVANFVHAYAGWYPRWWLSAALLCSMIMLIGSGLNFAFCPSNPEPGNEALMCSLERNTTYVVRLLLIWSLFALCWLFSLCFGLRIIEAPMHMRTRAGNVLRTLTTFEPLHATLLVQGLIAVVLLHIMWWRNIALSIPFALLWICAFVAHCSLFQRSTAGQRQRYLTAYGFVALVLVVIEMLFKADFFTSLRSEWTLLAMQGILVLIGLIAIFWRVPAPEDRVNALVYDARVYRASTPLAVLGSLWPFKRFFPRIGEQ